jgi:hypothetical protein
VGSKKLKEFIILKSKMSLILQIHTSSYVFRDVTTGSTGTTEVAPKFLDSLILFQGADSAHLNAEVAPKISPLLHL